MKETLKLILLSALLCAVFMRFVDAISPQAHGERDDVSPELTHKFLIGRFHKNDPIPTMVEHRRVQPQ